MTNKTNVMKKKLNIESFTVKSFVTSIVSDNANTIVGGARRDSNTCQYDSEIVEGEGCVKSAFSDCAIPLRAR